MLCRHCRGAGGRGAACDPGWAANAGGGDARPMGHPARNARPGTQLLAHTRCRKKLSAALAPAARSRTECLVLCCVQTVDQAAAAAGWRRQNFTAESMEEVAALSAAGRAPAPEELRLRWDLFLAIPPECLGASSSPRAALVHPAMCLASTPRTDRCGSCRTASAARARPSWGECRRPPLARLRSRLPTVSAVEAGG